MRYLLVASIVMAAVPAATADLILPGAAHTPGLAGTQWVTDLRVVNPSTDETASAVLSFTLYDGGSSVSLGLTLQPGELAALDDLVAGSFDRDGSGYLVLSADLPLVAGQRTSNLTAAGSFGQYIPAVAAVSGELFLTGMRGGDFRTNLGLVNPGATTSSVTVAVAAGRQVVLEAGVGTQLGAIQEWSEFDPAGESGSVIPTAALATYTSVVDNRTGDPTYVPGLRPLQQAVVPGLAHAPGANGTVWRSDLYLYAPSDLTVLGTLVLYGEDGVPQTPQLVEDLEAGETRVLEDVVALLAPGREGTAVLWLSTMTSPVVALARTYNLAQDGTYGQSMAAVPPSAQIQAGDRGVFLFAARDPSGQAGFRSNLALVNPSLLPAVYTVELLDDGGELLGSGSVTVPARSAVQRNDVVDWLGVAALADGVIRVNGAVPFTGYLSSVDNRTGDASTVLPVASAASAR